MKLPVLDLTGSIVDEIDVSDDVFGAPINNALIWQSAVTYEANQRQGTRDTKTRGEVAGGGHKPYRQKGTGRARQGSTRAPHFRKGGVVFGPHPKDFRKRMPVKMRRAALRSALSGKVQDAEMLVVRDLALEAAKTKLMAATLKTLGIDRTAVIVTADPDPIVIRSARNIPGIRTVPAATLNIGDVLKHRYLVLTVDAIRRVETRLAVARATDDDAITTGAVDAEEADEA